MINKRYDISTLGQLNSVASKLLRLSDSRIFAMYGDLGVGKTTLVKHMSNHLNVIDEISGPTFSIVNEYLTLDSEKIFHFDCYRLESIQEAVSIGIESYLNSGFYCFVEWPSLLQPMFPKNHHVIEIKLSDDKRELIILK